MSGDAGHMPVYGLGCYFQIPGDLACGHATGDLHDDLSVQVGTLLPVGGAEGLGAEAAFADFAGKPLDTVRGLLSPVGTNAFERPSFLGVVVVYAVGVWAERRGP